jgi:hypothetical protein
VSEKQKTSNLLGTSLLVAGLFCVFAGERVFGQDMLRNVGSGLGVLLLLIASVLRVNAFNRAQGDVRGVEARLLAAYAGVLAALLLYALSTDAVTELMKLDDEARKKVVGILSVSWIALMTVSLSALLFMELVYARMPIAASVELRRVRTAAQAGLTLAFSVVFLLSLNYVVTARDVRKDLSYFKTTEPSQASMRMLDKLESPVKAILFWRKTDDVLQQTEPYFAALAKHNKNFSYEVLDSAFVPELCRKHKVNGNGSVLLLSGEGDTQKGQPLQIGNELTEARNQLKKLDASFQQNFAKLTRAERSVAFTVGHGERNGQRDESTPGEGIKIVEEVLRRLNVKQSKLGVAQGLGAAPPDGSGAVVVLGPQEKFLPEESSALLDYVRKGGRLLLMVDPGDNDGLDPLLRGLGVVRQPGALASEKNHVRRAHDKTDAGLVFSNKYSSHPSVTTASRFQNEVATIFVSGVGLDRAPAADLTPKPNVSFPLRSGPGFFRDLDGDFERDANEPDENLNMLAAVTLTEKPGAPEGRVIVIGDGDFMTDKIGGNKGNVMLFVDSLAWLIGNEELNAEVSSEEDIPIEHSRDRDKLWFYATTFGVPLPLLGLSAWVARRRRRPSEAGA